jgi:hypothetical protein
MFNNNIQEALKLSAAYNVFYLTSQSYYYTNSYEIHIVALIRVEKRHALSAKEQTAPQQRSTDRSVSR